MTIPRDDFPPLIQEIVTLAEEWRQANEAGHEAAVNALFERHGFQDEDAQAMLCQTIAQMRKGMLGPRRGVLVIEEAMIASLFVGVRLARRERR